MTVLGKINKDFLLYNGIYQVTMPRGLGWSFSRIGKHIERCLQTISMTQSYYEPIQYDLDGKEDLLYWRKLLYLFPDMSSIKSYSNIPHNRKVVHTI
jgi:uncharacterized alpha-E superfamily protein